MLDLVTAIGSILAAWAVLLGAFFGIGLILGFGRLEDRPFAPFWSGWAIAILILQVWHLVSPVNKYALLLILSLGAAGLLWHRNKILTAAQTFAGKPRKRKLVIVALLLVAAVWPANHALNVPYEYDTGLYHLQAVRWISTYPIVPGLGNLHGRLAFNNSYFLYTAMLSAWTDRAHHLAGGVILWVLFAQFIWSSARVLFDHDDRLSHRFTVALLPALLSQVQVATSGYSSDFPVFALGLVLSITLLHTLESETVKPAICVYITALSALGISIKLSFVIMGAITTLLVCLRFIQVRRTFSIRIAALAGLFGLLILVPWTLRGIIASGYIAYPSTFGAFPVDWRIPAERAIDEANWIYSWARQPGLHWKEVLGNWDWLPHWAYRMLGKRTGFIIPSLLTLTSLVIIIKRPSETRISREIRRLLMPAAASVIFWFFTAPDPRLAGAGLWILGAGAWTLALDQLDIRKKLRRNVLFTTAILLSTLALIDFSGPLWIAPGPDGGFYPLPTPQTFTVTADSGLAIYIPYGADEDRCWDYRLPCTPYSYFDRALRLRVPGEMQHGFRLDSTD